MLVVQKQVTVKLIIHEFGYKKFFFQLTWAEDSSKPL